MESTPWSSPSQCRGGLSKQKPLRLLGDRRLRVDRFSERISAFDGRTCTDDFEPTVQMGEILDVLSLASIGNDPRIACHVGDRIGARNELPMSKLFVEHGIEAAPFPSVRVPAIDGLSPARCVGKWSWRDR